MSNERQLQQKAYEINYLRNQGAQLEQEIAVFEKAIQDLGMTQKALDALSEKPEHLMFPIGAAVFVKAKPMQDTVLVDVGARVIVEKDPKSASDLLQTRKAAIQKNLDAAQGALTQLMQRMESVSAEAEKLQRG